MNKSTNVVLFQMNGNVVISSLKKAYPWRMIFTKVLLLLFALNLPNIGYCDSGGGWFGGLFDSKDKHMNDVAVKIAELRDDESMSAFRGLAFSPDGEQLAIDTGYGMHNHSIVKIWDWRNERLLQTLANADGANNGSGATDHMFYSPDGRLLVSCHSRASGDSVIRIWDTHTWEIVHDIIDHIPGSGCNGAGFTSDGKALIRVFQRNYKFPPVSMIVYDASTWQATWELQTGEFVPHTLALSADGKLAALGGERYHDHEATGEIAIVDLERRAIIHIITDTWTDGASHLAWSPDGRYLMTIQSSITSDQTSGTQIFDAHSWQKLQETPIAPPLSGLSLRYSPNGKYLFIGNSTATGSGSGAIWDSSHQTLLQELSGNISGIAVSRDGRYLATGEYKTTVIRELK
jgi:WD40 repeat protein